jgi:WXXGXW repeat (2 copies)
LRRFSFVTALLFVGLAACNKPQTQSAEVSNGDPANGNLASTDQSGAPSEPTPPVSASGQSYAPPAGDYPSDYDQTSYAQPVEASEPPPPLPDYSQPPAPGDDYIWTPGYWGYASSGYYWVPGAWIVAPYVGALWTPPWWGYDNNVYQWHTGYWGPHIGFYGGINYGFGYTGRGYYGAYWNNGTLDYNRSVTNVNVSVVHNVYNYSVPNSGGNRVSYNGGRGGVEARPTPQELAVVRDPRTPPVSAQMQHAREASSNRAQFATAGGGHPAALVATRPIATSYKAPESHPPAAAMRAAQAAPITPPRPEERTPARAPEPENRTTAQRPAPAQTPENRPAQPARPEARPAPARPAAPSRSEVRPQPAARPQEAARPQPAARPQEAARPQAAARPQPAARPEAPRQEAKPKPAAPPRPAPKPKEEEHKEP